MTTTTDTVRWARWAEPDGTARPWHAIVRREDTPTETILYTACGAQGSAQGVRNLGAHLRGAYPVADCCGLCRDLSRLAGRYITEEDR